MSRNIKFNQSDNSAKKFLFILEDLKEIANKNEMPVQDVIRMFISDLRNLNNNGYENKLEDVKVEGRISESLRNELISFLSKAAEKYIQAAKNEQVRQEQEERRQKLKDTLEDIVKEENITGSNIDGVISDIKNGTTHKKLTREEKNYVLKELNKLKEKEEKRLKKESEWTEKLEKKWKTVVATVEAEALSTGRSKVEIWDKINENLRQSKLKVAEPIKEKLQELVDEKIKQEGIPYYEAVKKYTNNFEFLPGFTGISFATSGHRKISDPNHSRMFKELLRTLSRHQDETSPKEECEFLKGVLSDNSVNTYYGRKIIEARINRIERDERNKKEKANKNRLESR